MAQMDNKSDLDESVQEWKENIRDDEFRKWLEKEDIEGDFSKLLCLLEKTSVEDVISEYPKAIDLYLKTMEDKKLPGCGSVIIRFYEKYKPDGGMYYIFIYIYNQC